MAKKTTSRAQGQGKGMFFFLVCRWMQMINEESRCDRHRSFLLSNGGDGYAMQFVKKGKKKYKWQPSKFRKCRQLVFITRAIKIRVTCGCHVSNGRAISHSHTLSLSLPTCHSSLSRAASQPISIRNKPMGDESRVKD